MDTKWLVLIQVAVGYLIAFTMILRIVLQRREPTATLAWVLLVILLPYLGALLYLLVGRRRLRRQLRRRLAQAAVLEPHLARMVPAGVAELAAPAAPNHVPKPQDRELLVLSDRIGQRPPTCCNKVTLLPDANQTYAELEAAIREARDHVHLLYYIFQQDETGARFRDLLIEKVKAGIVVRVLVDGVGSFGADEFMIPFVQAGGAFAEFLPVGALSRHWHPNLRNHRKIAVVDGKVGFTGGVNIGDEYTGRKRRVGRWRDTHIKLEGPAVHLLQEVFAEDWCFATEENLEARWFPEQQPRGDAMVQIIASGPDTDTQPLQRIFFTAVTLAKQRVYLTTPYFIPDQAMLVALETAALRGVDVRLLLPRRSDLTLVMHAGRSYFYELLKSGVRVYEYQLAILHAKSMVVDDGWATVGSANMDIRSFQLNFEVNAAVYGASFAQQLAQLFERDLEHAHQITLEDLARKPLSARMAEGIARVMSPVL